MRQLVREALDQSRELVRLEVLLARNEIESELSRAKASAIALSSAGVAAIASFTVFMVAIALAFSLKWLGAVIIAAALLLVAGALGLTGRKLLPRKPLPETTKRIGAELNQLKERVQ
jgi:peptidoglycan/LPS O-acetylase OafA/YrhL